VTTPSGEPAWKQRAVERSTRTVKIRAEERVERFLAAAHAIINEKGNIDFTVQEVVDRSNQSLRSFYQHFGGKHELLLALFEDVMRRSAVSIRAAADDHDDPLEALQVAVARLFDVCRPDPVTQRPLFTDFAPRLLTTHPAEVRVAHAPLLGLFTEIMTRAQATGQLRAGLSARRTAALTMQTVMFTAQSNGVSEPDSAYPLTAEEVWDFCSRGFTSA
jgi:AcrR family transcriptional regulator